MVGLVTLDGLHPTPRKGSVTIFDYFFSCLVPAAPHTPQGVGNRLVAYGGIMRLMLHPTPRKGSVTHRFQSNLFLHQLHPTPRKGSVTWLKN